MSQVKLFFKLFELTFLHRVSALSQVVTSYMKYGFQIDTWYNTICNSSRPPRHGVCVFVKSSFHAYKDNVLCFVEYSESVWCRVPLSGNDCLILGVIYHSPNSDSEL